MAEVNISHEFRSKNVNETRNYLLKEIEQNELMSRKHKKVLASAINGWISISDFASLLGIPKGNYKFCNSIKNLCNSCRNWEVQVSNWEKEKYSWQIVLLAKSKLNNIDVLISTALIGSNISHDEFVLINNLLKKYDKKKLNI